MVDLALLEPPISQEDTSPTRIVHVQPVTLASIGRRFGALIVDAAIVGFAFSAAQIMITPTSPLWRDFFVNVVLLLFAQAYYLLPYCTTGQTPGKFVFGIRVISTDGTPLNWRKGLLRQSGSYLSTSLASLGYIWANWDKKRQTWHDKIAKTCVVLASDHSYDHAALEPETPETPMREFLRNMLIVFYVLWLVASIVVLMPPVQYVLANGLQSIQGVMLGHDARLYDEEFMVLYEVLNERWGSDDSIPTANVGFDTYQTGEHQDVWLVIEVSYTETCNTTPSDPCEALVDELAGIALDHYGRIDELTGMSVQIVNSGSAGFVEWSSSPISKTLTIEDWHKELGD